ncbi:MAG: SH3 domain-containing protein [Thermoleophilia bacterium]
MRACTRPRSRAGVRGLFSTLAATAMLAVLMASCSGGGETTTTGASESTTSTTVPSSTAPDDPTLPGEPLDLGFPKAGDVLSVVGVTHNSRLNVRAAPGTDQEILAKAEPLADDLVASGRVRQLPDSIWYEVRVSGVSGWVSSAYVAYSGAVDDITAQVTQKLGGSAPAAETMTDLGRIVAEVMASDDPPSRIVVAVTPHVGDLGEITYDVIGVGDDAIRGYRLHVFGTPTASGEGFSLKSVESTLLAGRGVTADGLAL